MDQTLAESSMNFTLARDFSIRGDLVDTHGGFDQDILTQFKMINLALDLSSIVAFTDAAGTITYVNDNFCKISGYSRDELVGSNHRIINSGYHQKEFFTGLWRTISSGQVWRGEVCNRKKDGTHYWVDSTIIPFPEEGPHRSRYVAIRNDISERKRLLQELEAEQMRTFFSEKMASLGEITAGIAHELGNPIATIQGRAEMLKMAAEAETGPLSEQTKKTVDIILRLTERMSGILRSVTSFARDGTKDPFIVTPLPMLLENTIEFGAEKYRKRGINVSIDPYNPELAVECRETQIIQILVNLINNSCDAIQGLDQKWIRISVSDQDNEILIQVIDSGSGIPAELQSKIFSQFFTTKEVGKGTGLGLHISRNLARLHGGDLYIEKIHPNTCFVLSLPKRQVRDPAGQ